MENEPLAWTGGGKGKKEGRKKAQGCEQPNSNGEKGQLRI